MKIINQNKKAKFLYFLGDSFQAGIVLKGSEVKSIRDGGISLDQSYVTLDSNGELYLINCYIKPYKNTSSFAVEERRRRKLLLNKSEINKISKHIKIKGGTVVPLKVFINDKGLVKVDIAIAKGKKNFEKNQASKDASREKEIKMMIKQMNI
jgi:SsrA-binding protein